MTEPNPTVRPRMLIDCDPGHDDAIALLCAARYADVVGITSVNGNVSQAKTTHNALIVAQLAGIRAPVHAGAAHPLISAPRWADHIHGVSGLDGPELPELTGAVASEDAVGFILEASRTIDDLWLVPTGPLTNIALAIRHDPDLVDRVNGIVLMGGSTTVGNVTPAAEFNIWADPEAAAIVFASGASLTMVGLNLTHQVRMGAAHAEQLRAAATTTSIFAASLLDFFAQAYNSNQRREIGAAIHDACAVLAITHPDLIECEPRHVTVELNGAATRGMTLVDQRGFGEEPVNAQVAYRVDAERAIGLIMAACIDPQGS